MSYIALARKWRPRTFSELLGQEHLTRALSQSLDQNRVHHAYLFTGTRGVGKTSVARIMAKALNCEQGMSAQPCLTCDACVAIEQGRFIDLIEIDAASKTRVEDTRELLDNVQYAPSIGRYKIYLIDEVHMLSQHSFNALLKTLEEPPAHVIFLLATTDPQKLPITILSRCLQFNLKHVQDPTIIAHLQTILQDEHIAFEPQALTMIAKAAHGSMRDALSLLDQAIVSRHSDLSADSVATLLGQTTEDYALQLVQAFITRDPKQLIMISKHIGEHGGHFRYVLEELLSYFHRIALYQAIPNMPQYIESLPIISELAQKLSAEDIQLCYQIGIKGMNDLPYAPTIAMGFEMTLLRMYTFRPASPQAAPKLSYEDSQPSNTPKTTLIESPQVSAEERIPPTITESPAPNNSSGMPSWTDIIPLLKLSGLALSAVKHTEFLEKDAGQITLKVEKAHKSVFTAPVIERIQSGLSDYYQEPVRLTFEYHDKLLDSPAAKKKITDNENQQKFAMALQSDPVFQQIQKEFSADLVKDSVSALQDSL